MDEFGHSSLRFAAMTTDDFDAQLAALVGKPISAAGPTVAPDPVNQPMIRHWAAAFEDWNPVYTDPDTAAQTRFGGIHLYRSQSAAGVRRKQPILRGLGQVWVDCCRRGPQSRGRAGMAQAGRAPSRGRHPPASPMP